MVTTLTIIRYRKLFIPFALLAMAIHRLPLLFEPGCTFWKLMGSGRNGTFDLRPDLQQWALLTVWKDKIQYDRFCNNSFISCWWKAFYAETWTVILQPISAHGKWDGKEPFGGPVLAKEDHKPVAVLTRATIRTSKLRDFWRNVAPVAALMAQHDGYITSFGIGEAPFFRQATFSIWKDHRSMTDFAYRSPEHSEVIRRTRSGRWYAEELFARFRILESHGTIRGINPLTGQETINYENNS